MRTLTVLAVIFGLAALLHGPQGAAGAPAADTASVPGSIVAGGLQRTFRLYVPPSHDRARPAPLVIVLHGGFGTGATMERLTAGGFNRLAARDGFVVVYPDGVERHWNDGRGIAEYRSHRDNIDDVGFIAALIDHLAQTQGIDRQRVYAAGISNGGLLAQRLARELAPRVTAIGVVAISMSDKIAQMRPPARPISVLIMLGTEDPLVPWDGGGIAERFGRDVGRVLSIANTVRAWATHNGCPARPEITRESDRDPADGTRVRRESYAPCVEGTEVALYAIEGGGHTWPGGWQYLPQRYVGRTSRDIDANEVLWAFFKRHAIR
jgi:polyhydroxybutyrate depolymerase